MVLLQYPLKESFTENWKYVQNLLKKVLRKSPDLIVFPEMWLGSPADENVRNEWVFDYSLALKEVKKMSVKNKVAFCFSQLEKSGKQFFNTSYFIGADGSVKGKYRKIHLFSYGGETKSFSAGDQVQVFKSVFGKIGLAICYDIRFPELIRQLTTKGMQILLVNAQWPQARIEHWHTLLRARAIENQIFVIGVNRLGRKGPIVYNGHSVVFDPWGHEVLHLDAKKEMGFFNIDLKQLEKIRKQYPFLKERRPHLF